MRNQEELETSKAAVANVISWALSAGELGKTLSDIAFLANKYDLRFNRQTLHNWYHKKYLPNRNTLHLYIYKLSAVKKSPDDEAQALMAFFQEILEAAQDGEKTE